MIIGSFLPPLRLCISDFLDFPLQPLAKPNAHPSTTPSIHTSCTPPNPQYLTTDFLHSIPYPSESDIRTLVAATNPNQCSFTIQSILLKTADGSDQCWWLPLEILPVWLALANAHQTQAHWMKARSWMEKVRTLSPDHINAVSRIGDEIELTSWGGKLAGFSGWAPVTTLATYASNSWLRDTHIQQLLDVLERQLPTPISQSTLLADPFFSSAILEEHSKFEKKEAPNSSLQKWLVRLGSELRTGEKRRIAGLLCITDNHWLVYGADWDEQVLVFGDPMRNSILQNVISAFQWWLETYAAATFRVANLPTTKQVDMTSCGLLSFNGVAHWVDSSVALLETGSEPLTLARLSCLKETLSLNASFVSGLLGISHTQLTLPPPVKPPRLSPIVTRFPPLLPPRHPASSLSFVPSPTYTAKFTIVQARQLIAMLTRLLCCTQRSPPRTTGRGTCHEERQHRLESHCHQAE